MLVTSVLIIYATVLIFLAILIAFEVFYVVIKKAPPVISTEKKVYQKIKEKLKGRQGLTYVELGSGKGKGLRIMAEDTNWEVYGYEFAPRPYLYAKVANWIVKKENISMQYQDMFKADLSSADVVYCYLFDTTNKELEPKLLNELKTGALVFTYAFTFSKLLLIDTIELKRCRHKYLYVYQRQ